MRTGLIALTFIIGAAGAASAGTREDLVALCTSDPSSNAAYCNCAADKFEATLNEVDRKILVELTRANVEGRTLTEADVTAMATAHGITAQEYGERAATVGQFAIDVDWQCTAAQ
jgi:D-tyrosyl-tRNA(Tyr) deacylase